MSRALQNLGIAVLLIALGWAIGFATAPLFVTCF